ncbi:copper resistance CopC family protein [Quadrisphaera sp. KR29]|uniref:copper resistance CopC family protein n=1 Tax=Quadrisphaera sp. KR29 TaxID=3461391 RepID=UPI0040440C81
MSRAHGARRLLAAIAGLLLVVLPALPAQAHDRLVASSPADGAVLDAAPPSLVLTFSAPALALGSRVVVTGPTGAVVSTGEPQYTDDTVVQALGGDLPAGEYRVQWRVTSSDGHPVSGELAWTASAPAAGDGSAAGAAAPSPPSPAAPSSAPAGPPSPATAPASATAPDGASGAPPWVVALAAAALAALVAAAVAVVRRRRSA